MFEQSSQSHEYRYEPAAEPLKEGDPFYNYEIRNWDIGPRIYKILGVSTVINVALLLIVAQTSLLTMKGCDSPLVGSMCQVLDTVYVGSMLFGTDREYVDAEYVETDLGDADITYVDVTGADNQKLYYPANYFQIANPEKYDPVTGQPIDQGFGNLEAQNIPGIPNSSTNGFGNVTPYPSTPPPSGSNLFNTPQHLPKQNANPLSGFSGGSETHTSAGPRNVRPHKGQSRPPSNTEPGAEGDPNENHAAEVKPTPLPTAEPTDPVQAVVINREPLKKYGRAMAQRIESHEVDINAPFKVEAEAVLTSDGHMDTSIDPKTKQKRSRITSGLGDEKLVKAASEAIAAVGDSGWLGYLSSQKIEKIRFVFGQTDDKMIVTIFADAPKGKDAQGVANGLNILKQGASLLNLGDDEKTLLSAATIGVKDKQMVVYFELPNQVAQAMIARNIQRAKEEEQNRANNAAASATPVNPTKN